ncbi:lipopolysaccharide biosynthesis [Aestuariibacter halophilus]|uniref:Lipopolysaccharide biosynthesis n=1 Tax=Fluctibacter halophilus TaxID=226011 RepID=A0ABS8G6L2_9ALTE|nr:XrtA system polysaccharide chain length determinant [Aestuariibacter halophilus]MCC2614851.1 lipopolysaccharide biosynthesis [Aestuariibacter halophilus]
MLGIQEAIDQVMNYVKGVWIKKRYIIVSSWLICPIGWGVVATMPDEYESSARLFVDTNSLLRPLLRGLAVYNNPEQQVNLVAQTLLSRPNLEKIAREADLDITVNTQAEMDELVEGLRQNIKIASTQEQNIYTIRYTSESPELSQRVVRITLNEFIESSLGSNRQSSDSAEEFLTRQIEEYEQRLEEAEQRLADFKISRIDRAPGETGDYYAQLQRVQDELQVTELRLLELESQLKAAKDQLSGEAPVFGLAQQAAPSADLSPAIATKYDARIANMEANLDELLIRYTDNHPDVVKTKSMLENLREDRAKLIKELSQVAQSTGSYSQFGNINQNPVYQEMKLAVAQYENQIASLRVRAEQYRKRQGELKQIIDLVPQIEAEAQGLNRDYEITRQKYLELLQRKEQAELSRKAEATSDDVQFREIDPPTLPTKPTGPNRIMFYSLVLIFGFGTGLGIAFLVSQIKPVVLSASQLKNTFNIPVFGYVSHTEVEAMTKVNKRNMLIFTVSSVVVVGIYVMLVWSEFALGGSPLQLMEGLL